MLVPGVMNTCVPVMVNHGVPVGACVRACVRACVCVYNRKRGSIIRSPVYVVHRSFLLSVQWVPVRPLVRRAGVRTRSTDNAYAMKSGIVVVN